MQTGIANPLEEVLYLINKSQQIAIFSSTSASDLASRVVILCGEQGRTVPHLSVIDDIALCPQLAPSDMVISSDRYLDDNKAGVVIFT